MNNGSGNASGSVLSLFLDTASNVYYEIFPAVALTVFYQRNASEPTTSLWLITNCIMIRKRSQTEILINDD